MKARTPQTLCGVAGTIAREGRPGSAEFNVQQWKSAPRLHPTEPERKVRAFVRFDDDCRNGHNSFAVTGETYRPGRLPDSWVVDSAGCVHEDIAAAFPELAHLIRWHLCSTDGPMHYVGNAAYHASDRDHWGLRAGEFRQQRDKEGRPRWKLALVWADGAHMALPYGTGDGRDRCQVAADIPPALPAVQWVPDGITGEGKARDFDAARSCAVWPEATDAELSVDRPELEQRLRDRLPALLAAMRADIEGAGLLWANE